jgi:CubicO group peptidase (beta-lactamase class C family)
MQSMKIKIILALLLTIFTACAKAQDLYIDPADDEKYFGAPEDLLTWTPEQQIAGYRNIEKIGPARLVPASTAPLSLPRDERDLGTIQIDGEFEEEPFSLTVDEFFERQRVAGLLVIRNGAIIHERYGLGNTESSRWVSFSVTKSVVSLLYGAAIRDGYIANVDEKVSDYLPRLQGSSYDQASIKTLLQMASGVTWNEDYSDPESDISTATWETLALYEFLAGKPRAAPPGEVFNYNTAETNLSGNLLRAAIGNNLSVYLHQKIWQPFGMEADAWWPLTEEGGGEFGGCCLAATLRDYGRIGLFALAQGHLSDGTQVLREGWIEESITPSEGADFYGYYWWLSDEDAYRAAGIFGQAIYVNPVNNVVIALQSALETASNQKDWAIQAAMLQAVNAALE